MKFTYRWGQQPLAGFTIKRGLGQGGFGEVYFAVSDGGKEVALKLLVRGRTETELRGISNCLNLKHPNLVHLYDLRTDEREDHWLVMEYVQGEPLSGVLNRNTRGLPVAQAKEWFLQIARAVAYLHDHAVVHRDIKPGNVFVENGILKLGDYGLSKTVGSASLTQSANVGTVYYMAPEVARGACTKQVDIYACGVMLYEMLTGELPFRGDSWAEVALRHQTDTPELNKLPGEYLAIVEKALHKKPELRYSDMEEMIRAVEAIGATARQPVADISETVIHQPTPTPVQPTRLPPPLPENPSAVFAIPGMRDRLAEMSSTLALTPVASVITVVAWSLCSVFFTGRVDWFNLMPLFCLTVMISWGVLIPAKLMEKGKKGLGYWPTMLLGSMIGLTAFWLDGWSLPKLVTGSMAPPAEEAYFAGAVRALPGTIEHLVGYVLLFAFGLGLTKWSNYANRRRKERFSLGPVFVAGFVSFMLYIGWNIFMRNMEDPPLYMFLALAGSTGVVQLVSPWTPPPPPLPKRRKLQTV